VQSERASCARPERHPPAHRVSLAKTIILASTASAVTGLIIWARSKKLVCGQAPGAPEDCYLESRILATQANHAGPFRILLTWPPRGSLSRVAPRRRPPLFDNLN